MPTRSRISEVTRRAIFDDLSSDNTSWAGRFNEADFLARIYDMKTLPSLDGRFQNAMDDIFHHRVANDDGDSDWLLSDVRFKLIDGSDEEFLRFLLETVHPVVRPTGDAGRGLAARINKHLRLDGYELFETSMLSGRPVFDSQECDLETVATEEPGFPGGIDSLLASMFEVLRRGNETLAIEVLAGSQAHGWQSDHDNWNGGTLTWSIRLALELSIFGQIDEESRVAAAERLTTVACLFFDEYTNDNFGRVTVVPRKLANVGRWRSDAASVIADQRGTGVEGKLPADRKSKAYALDQKWRRAGGYAEVFRATHKPSGAIVAFKRAKEHSEETRARLKREIEEQRKLSHPNVMQILDHDEWFRWFTMPLATGDLVELRPTMSESMLVDMLLQISRGLEAAHNIGLVHRDVTPGNILAIDAENTRRWLVADWGLVRRARGKTTVLRTRANQPFGTDGFAAPELYDNAHQAGPEADVYGLGRVAAWAITNQWPIPNRPLLPEGPWRHVIQSSTEPNPTARVPTMSAFRNLVAKLSEPEPPARKSPVLLAADMMTQVCRGQWTAVQSLVALARANPTDADLFLGHVVDIPSDSLGQLVRLNPEDAGTILSAMKANFTGANWSGRDLNAANAPLQWFHSIAEGAEQCGNHGLLEDAAACLFEAEANWQRFAQRRQTRSWLERLAGDAAETVARALRRHPAACRWYLEEGWSPRSASGSIREALAESGRHEG